jgi:hypothetical protein
MKKVGSHPPSDPGQVEVEIATLDDLDLAALRRRWQDLYGNPPPKSLRVAFLRRACAHRLCILAFGDLKPETKRRLRAIAEAIRSGAPLPTASVRIKAGTRLIRAWSGETHVVTALDHGFEWRGQRFRSLSAIARTITGTNWNGNTFFGLKRRSASARRRPPRLPQPRPKPTERRRHEPTGQTDSLRGLYPQILGGRARAGFQLTRCAAGGLRSVCT